MQDLNEIYYIYRDKNRLYYHSKSIELIHGESFKMCLSLKEAVAEANKLNAKPPMPKKTQLVRRSKKGHA